MFVGIAIFVAIGSIIVVFVLIIALNRNRKNNAVAQSKKLDDLLLEIQQEILCVTGVSIPGREFKKIVGMVRGVSDTQATMKEQFQLIEKEALYNMLAQAKSRGGNAVVEIKLDTGSYEDAGSQWQVSQAVYTGTAVVI